MRKALTSLTLSSKKSDKLNQEEDLDVSFGKKSCFLIDLQSQKLNLKLRGKTLCYSPRQLNGDDEISCNEKAINNLSQTTNFFKRKMSEDKENIESGKLFKMAKLELADNIQQQIDDQIRMREGAMKLMSACSTLNQALETSKNLLTINARVLGLMSALQKKKKKHVLEEYHRQKSSSNSDIESDSCNGRLAISDIRVPLMWKDNVHFTGKTGDQSYYAFALLRCGDQVRDTLLYEVTSADTDMYFDHTLIFDDLTADFKIEFELYYTVITSNESHGIKTPIRTSMNLRTPKKTIHFKAPKFCLAGHAMLNVDDIKSGMISKDLMMGSLGASGVAVLGDIAEFPIHPLELWGQICCHLSAQPICMKEETIAGTVKIKVGDDWQERHCAVHQCKIHFWNDISDCQNDPKEVISIENNYQVEDESGSTTVILKQNNGVVRLEFKLNNPEDVSKWKQSLRTTVSNIRAWKDACDTLMHIEEVKSTKLYIPTKASFYDRIKIDDTKKDRDTSKLNGHSATLEQRTSVTQDNSTLVTKDAPTPVTLDSSTPLAQDTPTLVTLDTTAAVIETAPTPGSQTTATATSIDTPTPVAEDTSTQVAEDAPTPLVDDTPTPVTQDTPATVIETAPTLGTQATATTMTEVTTTQVMHDTQTSVTQDTSTPVTQDKPTALTQDTSIPVTETPTLVNHNEPSPSPPPPTEVFQISVENVTTNETSTDEKEKDLKMREEELLNDKLENNLVSSPAETPAEKTKNVGPMVQLETMDSTCSVERYCDKGAENTVTANPDRTVERSIQEEKSELNNCPESVEVYSTKTADEACSPTETTKVEQTVAATTQAKENVTLLTDKTSSEAVRNVDGEVKSQLPLENMGGSIKTAVKEITDNIVTPSDLKTEMTDDKAVTGVESDSSERNQESDKNVCNTDNVKDANEACQIENNETESVLQKSEVDTKDSDAVIKNSEIDVNNDKHVNAETIDNKDDILTGNEIQPETSLPKDNNDRKADGIENVNLTDESCKNSCDSEVSTSPAPQLVLQKQSSLSSTQTTV